MSLQTIEMNEDFSWRFNKENDPAIPLDWKVEGKFYSTNKDDKYRLHLALDLVAPEDFDLNNVHVLSFLFGT